MRASSAHARVRVSNDSRLPPTTALCIRHLIRVALNGFFLAQLLASVRVFSGLAGWPAGHPHAAATLHGRIAAPDLYLVVACMAMYNLADDARAVVSKYMITMGCSFVSCTLHAASGERWSWRRQQRAWPRALAQADDSIATVDLQMALRRCASGVSDGRGSVEGAGEGAAMGGHRGRRGCRGLGLAPFGA